MFWKMKKTKKPVKSPVLIQIVGLILSESYQRCKLFTQKLRKRYSKTFVEPVIKGYLDMDWVDYLTRLRKEVGGQTWAAGRGVVVFLNGAFLGGEKELFTRFSLYTFKQPTKELIKGLATDEYLDYMKQKNLLYTWFELSLDGEYMGSLLFELRPDLLPKTAVWFAMVCDPQNQLGYSYKNSKIHRVCKKGWFQGGKLGLGSSAGFLEDESFCCKHDRRGILSMANYGKDSNRAQFFVTFEPSEWMDEYYVAFGRVVEGSDLLRRLEYTKCTYEHPDHDIRIENCGLVGEGFGRNLVTKTKIKGLTVGEPHIHLETFMNIVLERFDEILFERLDEEVKQTLKGEWIGQLLWGAIKPRLVTSEPVADVLDVNDRSSIVFDPAMFIKGLYGLQDIPDNFIMGLLDEVIKASVDVVDTRDMVSGIFNLILNHLDLEGGIREGVSVKSLVSSLARNINDIVYSQKGSEISSKKSSASRKEVFKRSVSIVVSQTTTIRKILTEYSTYSMSQASYVEEEKEATPKASGTDGKEPFQKSEQKVASVSSIGKQLLEYQTVSVSRASVLEDEEEREPTTPTAGLLRRSVSGASHSSTVRKLMTDYEGFSVKPLVEEDIEKRDSLVEEKRSSTGESIVGYIWETLFRSFNA